MSNLRAKGILFFLFLHSTVFLLCQNNKSFGIGIQNDFNRIIFIDKNNTEPTNTYSVGLEFPIYFDLNDKFQILTGLAINYKKLEFSDFSLIFGCDITPELMIDSRNSFLESEVESLFLGIPLQTRYKVTGEENHLYTRFGLDILINLITNYNHILFECRQREGARNAEYELRNFIWNLELGLGYEFKVSKKTKAFIEPNIQHSINRIFNPAYPIQNGRLLSFGILLGLRFV